MWSSRNRKEVTRVKNRRYLLLGILLAISIAEAQSFKVGFGSIGQIITDVARTLMGILKNIWFMYLLTIILYFVLLYGIFSTVATKVKLFGEELNKNAKTFIAALSGLSTLGIFGLQTTTNINTVLAQKLGPFATFAGVVIGLGLFVMVYYGFAKDDAQKGFKLGLLVAGLGVIWVGYYLNNGTFLGLGFLIVFIAMLVMLIGWIAGAVGGKLGGLGGGGNRGGGGSPHGSGGSTPKGNGKSNSKTDAAKKDGAKDSEKGKNQWGQPKSWGHLELELVNEFDKPVEFTQDTTVEIDRMTHR